MGKAGRGESSPSKGHRAIQAEEQGIGIKRDTVRKNQDG